MAKPYTPYSRPYSILKTKPDEHEEMKRGFVREELLVVCLTKHTASAFTGHVKLDRFSVSPVLPPIPFVITSAQPQLVLLICGHPPIKYAKSSVFCSIGAAFQRRFETPMDMPLESPIYVIYLFILPCFFWF